MIKLMHFVRSGSSAALAVGLAVTLAAPAYAGEITGSGTDLPVNGNSLCAYSGLNDTPDGLWLPIGPGGALVQIDPGGPIQSYGYYKAQQDFLPSPSDPAARETFSFPATGCNPVN